MNDLYHLSREENVFLAKKLCVESIYSGMQMENRNVTFPQTETILKGINVPGVEIDDIQAILNMRDAWKFVLSHIDNPLDVQFLCSIQKRVAFREALVWGELRTGSIGISGVKYIPPIPDLKKAEAELTDLLSQKSSSTEKALRTFAWIARSQLFWDGNKRTAILAANKIMIEHGSGVLIVPDEDMLQFSTILSEYYESGNDTELTSFLYETSIFGIDSDAQQKQRAPRQENLSSPEKRTATWLKAMRHERKLTQRELAQAIGVATNSIANIEQGQRKGSDEVWNKIEKYFA